MHELVSKFERPPPGFTTPVSLRHIRSTRAGPRRRIIMANISHVPPSHRTATSDRTLRASGRRKARAPAEYMTAPPRASKRVEAIHAGGPELGHSPQWRACGAGTPCNEDGPPPRAALAAPLPRKRDVRVCAARESRGAAWELRPSALRAWPPGVMSRAAARGPKGRSTPPRAMTSIGQSNPSIKFPTNLAHQGKGHGTGHCKRRLFARDPLGARPTHVRGRAAPPRRAQ